MVRILIVNGQKEIQEEIENLLIVRDDFEIIGSGSDGYEALIMSDNLKPDILIMSTSLKLLSGVKVCSSIRERSPQTKVILTVENVDIKIIAEITVNGVKGVLLQRDIGAEIVTAVDRVACENRCFLGRNVVSHVVDTIVYYKSILNKNTGPEKQHSTAPIVISKVEMRIVVLIAKGLSNKEIAALLDLKEGTVRNYISIILHKIGYHHRTQIVIYAIANNLVDAMNIFRQDSLGSTVSKPETKNYPAAPQKPATGKTANADVRLEPEKK